MLSGTMIREQSRLRQHVTRFIGNRSPNRVGLARVLGEIRERRWHAFLFGGVLRDLMVHGSCVRPRDVDIVVDNVSLSDLASAFEPFVVRRTRFGGLHLSVDGWMFDIWPLADTWALREGFVGSRGPFALPRTTFLNVEAVAVEIGVPPGRPRRLCAHGFFEGIVTRTLEVNLEENPFPALCVVRSLITAARLGFKIGPRLAGYIVSHSRDVPIAELLAAQCAHYGRIRASKGELREWLRVVRDEYRLSRSNTVVLPMAHPRQLELWSDPLAAR